MHELDPILSSRELGRANDARLAWERRLRSQPSLDDAPLAPLRRLLGREGAEAAVALGPDDPLRRPLMRWSFLLGERRVNHPWYVEAARRRFTEEHAVQRPRPGQFTIAAMLSEALRKSETRAAWLAELELRAAAGSRALAVLWQRKPELARRLSLPAPDELISPTNDVDQLAEDWLKRSRDLAREFPTETFADHIELRLGSEAQLAWPSRISHRTLADWFRAGRLLDGLEPRIDTFPEPLGSASFARALVQFGHALRIAAASERQPFVVAHDPYGLEAWALGYAFAGLLMQRAFVVRTLDGSSEDAAKLRRVMARVWLFESRWLALKVILGKLARSNYESLRRRFEELSHDALGVVLAPDLALTLPSLSDDDAQRFVAAVGAHTRLAELCEAHDEDWFRNPRASDQLRSEAQLPPNTTVEDSLVQRGMETTLAALQTTLGS